MQSRAPQVASRSWLASKATQSQNVVVVVVVEMEGVMDGGGGVLW
jgi:hypothetical protein